MTRYDDPNWIGAIRETHGSHRFGARDSPGELSIRNGRAGGDSPQFVPDAALKCCASRLYRYIVYRSDVTRKIAVDRIPQAMRIVSRFELEHIFSIVQSQQAQHARFIVSPIDGT